MNSWELARYLIDAKKNIDSLLFVSEHLSEVRNIGLRDRVDTIRRNFYINCCVVLDKSHPKAKKKICENPIISAIYYERDKNGAHRDDDYSPKEYSSIQEMVEEMKEQLATVHEICSESLPKEITLNYVSHDKELFRFLYGITADNEEHIKHEKYPLYGRIDVSGEQITKKVFQDTRDIKKVENSTDYAVVMENGINFYESLQNRQDGCIKINVLYGEHMWCEPNQEIFEQIIQLQQNGFFDEYGIPRFPDPRDKERCKLFEKLLGITGEVE